MIETSGTTATGTGPDVIALVAAMTAGERRGPRRDDEPSGGDDRRQGRQRPHRPHFTPPPELPQRPKPKRLRPGKQHLSEVLASLPEEQRAVAELALQGMAAVRQRIREDNARSKAAGKPEMPEATVLKMAEDLLPQLRVADWLDRAEAARRQLAHLDLRDLRSVVAASEDPLVVRDESTRALAAELKAALAVKQDEELNLWLGDVEAAVDVGRVVRALRLSAMPPKAGVPFPAALGGKLGSATVAALTPDDPPDRWIAVLEAAAFSPIRTMVTPNAAPAQQSPELVATVTRLGPLLPQVAALFAIDVPDKAPAPKPLRPTPRKKEPARKPAAAAAKTTKAAQLRQRTRRTAAGGRRRACRTAAGGRRRTRRTARRRSTSSLSNARSRWPTSNPPNRSRSVDAEPAEARRPACRPSRRTPTTRTASE